MKDVVHVAAPVMTLIGVLVSAVGTFLLTEWFHPFDDTRFVNSVAKVLWLIATGRTATAKSILEVASNVVMKSESKPVTLFGLYIVFIGFIIQAVGAALWCADSIWDIYSGT